MRIGDDETGVYSFIDKKGEEVVKVGAYDYVGNFSEGLGKVRI